METDAFFCQLFKQLPQTFFELLGLPATQAAAYRFDSVELKKSLRIDGLFVPTKSELPLYFLEVQFQRVEKFYANLFAKVFCYLEENNPQQEWIAAAIFPTRKEEPKPSSLAPYRELLQSERVRRVYLEDMGTVASPSLGLGILQLLGAPMRHAQELAPRLLHEARQHADSGLSHRVIQLVEELLISRFPRLGREEVRMKFKLHDVRDSKVWKEAHDEGVEEGMEKGRVKGIEEGVEKGRVKGIEEGIEKGKEQGRFLARQELVRNLLAEGMTQRQIASILKTSVKEIERLAGAGK